MSENKKSSFDKEDKRTVDSPFSDNEDNKRISNKDLLNDFEFHITDQTNEFPSEIYPDDIEKFTNELTQSMDFPKDYVGTAILMACSSVIGTSFQYKFKKGWIGKGNLYMIVCGNPGDGKTPALNNCIQPLRKIDRENLLRFESEINQFKNLKEEDQSKVDKPRLKRMLLNDFTLEALIKHHVNNPHGITIYVDEIKGWLNNFSRYTQSGETEQYLSFWSGIAVQTDRATVEQQQVDDPFVNVLGSIQIKALKSLGANGRADNGFIDRFLFAYPHESKSLNWNEREITERFQALYNSIINKIYSLAKGKIQPEVIEFSKEAKSYLIQWQNDRPKDHFHEFEKGIEAKLQEYVLRFSLILEVVDSVCSKRKVEQITVDSVKKAIKLFHYFLGSALKVKHQIFGVAVVESLTSFQREIYTTLTPKFSTSEIKGLATKEFIGERGISERQLFIWLQDKNLFSKVKHGHYKKVLP
ncbi:DUF3987 domain-containing protein [Nonlabens antarcticus]|uniref:DUF3987 domain-containing protein n=1 Tax=Nonlabens antarcticus TaxID=392714 RepID=UPI001891BEB8|nr:DUF3987 domain-containing protein [Nonlabens antarcticus]